MQCANHPSVQAYDRCAGCAEPFCSNCLIELLGENYCGECKGMALSSNRPLIDERDMRPCKEADEALKYAIISLFCFGIILGPMAISKASKAKRMIEDDPRLTGSGKATAAIVIGIVAVVLWVLGLILRLSTMGQR